MVLQEESMMKLIDTWTENENTSLSFMQKSMLSFKLEKKPKELLFMYILPSCFLLFVMSVANLRKHEGRIYIKSSSFGFFSSLKDSIDFCMNDKLVFSFMQKSMLSFKLEKKPKELLFMYILPSCFLLFVMSVANLLSKQELKRLSEGY